MPPDLRDLPWAGRYGVLYVDFPWRFHTRSAAGQGGKGRERHYPTMTVEEGARLPVAQIAARDCWLFMWSTWPNLAQGDVHRLVEGWSDPRNPWVGVTGGGWAKRPRNWRGDPDKWQFGGGYLFRSAEEPLIVFRRGRPKWTGKSERNLWVAPIREHSRKPDEVREMIDRVAGGVPRLEMFARESGAPGWDVWGNEAGKFDV